MNKQDRQKVHDKYGGHCAYCGCKLEPGWHVDHIIPLRRFNGFTAKKEHDVIDNMNPACASCNINKHTLTVDGFRELITGFTKSLNRDSTQYKIAKRYGMVIETTKPVVFYFEQFEKFHDAFWKDHIKTNL